MKTSIPSNVWETKRSQIAVLYKEEEWPLKQVIKKIRTKDFNPTETQLRSRLKKWGVTKPSRQRRKKAPSQASSAACAAAVKSGEAELQRRHDSDPQHLSLPVPVSSPNGPEWDGRKQLVPAANQPHQATGACPCETDRAGSGITSPSELFLHTAVGNAYLPYPDPQPLHDLGHLPPFSYVAGSAQHCNVEAAGSTSRPGSLSSSEAVSPANSLPGRMPFGWRPQEGQVDPESRSTGSPASPWSYTPPDSRQPCSPTGLYMAESVPISPVGYPDYTKHVFADSAQNYPLCQTLSPTSDINFWEPAPVYRTWGNTSSSEQLATMNPIKIDRMPPNPGQQHGTSQRTTHECLAGNRQGLDTQNQSPILLPELTSSGSDSDAHIQDFSPVEGAEMEYLLPSPIMG